MSARRARAALLDHPLELVIGAGGALAPAARRRIFA